jgi:predicted RNA-binding protein (virulence factor B family)
MIKIGEYNKLTVSREVDFGVYLKDEEGQEILLPGKWVPEGTEPGHALRVFVYTDSEDRPIATTMEPAASLGEYAAMEVKAVAPFGAFLDWGLEKDLLLPKMEQLKPVKPGDTVVARVCLDYKTNRMIAVTKINPFLKTEANIFTPGQEVELMVYNTTPLGYQVLVNHQYAGLLYQNQVHENLRIGDRRQGYISKLREDGKLDVNLKPFGREGMMSDRERVLEALLRNDGHLPLGDKSDAEEISRKLNMSKKSYKRAIGILYKERLISISDYEINAVKEE